jgi:hypothetical protein
MKYCWIILCFEILGSVKGTFYIRASKMKIFTCLIHFSTDLDKTKMVYDIYIKLCFGMVSIVKICAVRAALYVRVWIKSFLNFRRFSADEVTTQCIVSSCSSFEYLWDLAVRDVISISSSGTHYAITKPKNFCTSDGNVRVIYTK